MESFWRDLRLGLRQLRTDKGFSVAAILTLTLGIGATATIFTVVNAVLLQELPYRDPTRLVMLQGSSQVKNSKGKGNTWPLSQMDFVDWRKRSTVFSEMSVWGSFAFNLQQEEKSQRLWGELVNDGYFPMLGVKPVLGRFFTADEDAKPLEQYVVVLGYNLWRSDFGADPGVVGRKLQLNGRFFEVVGVAPQGFRGLSDQADVWVPSMLPPVPLYLTVRGLRWASGAARLKPGVTVRQAQEELNGITAALAQEYPNTNQGIGAIVTPFQDYWLGGLRTGLLFLTLGACILLLIACINIASLLLTRAVAKRRAWAIQLALGASRMRLIRQLLTESVLLSLIGAAAGLLLAHWAVRLLIVLSGARFPSFIQVQMEPGVIVATVGLAVLCGLAFGLAPVWSSFLADITQNLGRSEKMEASTRGWRWFQNIVVIAQVALALTLSVDALLMAKSFSRLTGRELGFRSDNLLTFRVDIREPRYFDDAVAAKMLRETYLPRIAAVPGVQQMAMSDPSIPTDDWVGTFIAVETHDSDLSDGTYPAIVHAVSPGYFEILGVPIRKGRSFNMQDTQSNAVIVSQAMADQHWPGKDPIGKRIKLGARVREGFPWLSVIGVSAPIRQEGLLEEKAAPTPEVYVSLLQFVRRPLTANFLVRPAPGASMAGLRQALHREIMTMNPELPDYDMATMQERLAKQTGKARFQVILISTFATLALILASVGIYGVTSYSVTQRTREIAIRMSLGAARGSILRMVVGRGAVQAAIGLALGLAAVVLLSRYLADLLYKTSVTDPLILSCTSLALFLVTLAANYLPARRAAILDPLDGLRQ
ncbi:MAG: ABC transporter permease [Acidobacteria bacterium]|nr:ABC transporter permease [Acidobacteriota bacterium]